MNLPKNSNIYYGLAGGVLLIAAGFMYMQKQSLDDLTDQVVHLRATAEQEKGARGKLVSAQKDLGDLQAKLAHLEHGIPDAAYVPTMLRELEVLGKSNGVEVSGLRPAPKKPDLTSPDKKSNDSKPYEPLDLELKGKSSYAGLLKFVTAINTFPKILEVRTLSITPPATGSDTKDRRLDITLGLRAFLFKDPSQQKKEDSST